MIGQDEPAENWCDAIWPLCHWRNSMLNVWSLWAVNRWRRSELVLENTSSRIHLAGRRMWSGSVWDTLQSFALVDVPKQSRHALAKTIKNKCVKLEVVYTYNHQIWKYISKHTRGIKCIDCYVVWPSTRWLGSTSDMKQCKHKSMWVHKQTYLCESTWFNHLPLHSDQWVVHSACLFHFLQCCCTEQRKSKAKKL